MRTTKAIINDVIAFFRDNESVFCDVIEGLDSCNGYLGDNRYFSMEELDELYNGTEPSELLCRAFFGYDEETCTTDRYGNKTYGAFNPNRNYFRYNGYGNFVSADYKDYSDYLDEYAVQEMIANRAEINTIDDETRACGAV